MNKKLLAGLVFALLARAGREVGDTEPLPLATEPQIRDAVSAVRGAASAVEYEDADIEAVDAKLVRLARDLGAHGERGSGGRGQMDVGVRYAQSLWWSYGQAQATACSPAFVTAHAPAPA